MTRTLWPLLTAISALKQVMSVREMKVLTSVGREMSESKRQYEYFCKYLDEAMTETGRGWMTISPIAICPKWLWSWPCAVTPARWPRRQVTGYPGPAHRS